MKHVAAAVGSGNGLWWEEHDVLDFLRFSDLHFIMSYLSASLFEST